MDTLITTQMSVSLLIQYFEEGNIAIPEIQRDVVWKSDQVKDLVDSISQGYPCGSLILWEPRDRDEHLVRSMIRPERRKQFQDRLPQYFLLDGQQRLTSLASILLKRDILQEVLAEFEEEMPYLFGNLRKFPREIEATTDGAGYKFPWVSLNRLFDGSIKEDPDYRNRLSEKERAAVNAYTQRIRDYLFPIQIIRGRDYPTVGEIFARVNSQGTQLTGAEIHMANIVPHWPGITKEFRKYRNDLHKKDYELDLTFLMRAITVIECGVPQIKKLAEKVSKGVLKKRHLDRTWRKAKGATDKIIRMLQRELGLDKTKFFTSKNVLVPLVYYVAKEKCRTLARKNILRFFLLSQLSEHYGGAGETVLRRDLRHLTEPGTTPRQGLESLADSVDREARPNYRGLKIKPDNVNGVPSKNVMLLMMYIIMRQHDATDLALDGSRSLSEIRPDKTQLHHIFPFNFMMTDKEAGRFADEMEYTPSEFRAEVNDIANLTFVSRAQNASIGDTPPWQYLENFTSKAIRKAHFIPEDRNLWRTENFNKFLAERRRLLAKGMNALLKSLC